MIWPSMILLSENLQIAPGGRYAFTASSRLLTWINRAIQIDLAPISATVGCTLNGSSCLGYHSTGPIAK
jgi:hypothetical protein